MKVTGHIILIQEERIRMLGDDGRGYLLTLATDAETEDLEELLDRKEHVLVEYEGEPDLDSGVVHKIRKIPSSGLEVDSVVLSESSVL